MILPQEVRLECIKAIAAPGVLNKDEVKWCLSILDRPERDVDGSENLAPLIEACQQWVADPPQGVIPVYRRTKALKQLLESMKMLYYRQPRILICVPSRKQFVKDGEMPPNLGRTPRAPAAVF